MKWWREHPAYEALLTAFSGSTVNPNHLAFLALTTLRAHGFEVVNTREAKCVS